MKVTGPWRDAPETQAVCAMLTRAGHQALFVGGCVRDALFGRPVHDIDIATDARPDRVMALAEAAGLKAIPTGIDHGTITVVADGKPHEITTFRKDIATDGRRAVVAFADDARTDAMRRDFTMNALYAQPDGTLVDPLGGLPDAKARRVRFIGAPADRIREDYLRILRYFRFSAWFADPDRGSDADTLAEIAEHLDGLGQLADERVTAELTKTLAAPNAAPILGVMDQCGVLGRLLPVAHVPSLAAYHHLAGLFDMPVRLTAQLAALGDAEDAPRLRLDKATAKAWQMTRQAATDGQGAAELSYRHGSELASHALLVRGALMGQPVTDFRAEVARTDGLKLPVVAADLMPAYQGAALGARLKDIEARWIASDFTLDRDALLS